MSAALFIVGAVLGSTRRGTNADPAKTYSDTIIVFDTVRYVEPKAATTEKLGKLMYKAPIVGATRTDSISEGYVTAATIGSGDGGLARADSADVELTVIQRHYADSTYEAWVSGPVDPRLDSINIYQRHTVITTQQPQRHSKWSVGVTGGAGFTARGVQPFIGIGISYAIFRF